MQGETILTGITTSGTPHLGNYVGAIRPAIKSLPAGGRPDLLFWPTTTRWSRPRTRTTRRSTLELAATWIACGLDTESPCSTASPTCPKSWS